MREKVKLERDKSTSAAAPAPGIVMVTEQQMNDVSTGSHDSCHHRDVDVVSP